MMYLLTHKPVLTFLQSKIANIEATIARRLSEIQLQKVRKGHGVGQGLEGGDGDGEGGIGSDGNSGNGNSGSGGVGGGGCVGSSSGIGNSVGSGGVDVGDSHQSVSDDALLLDSCNFLLDQACWL